MKMHNNLDALTTFFVILKMNFNGAKKPVDSMYLYILNKHIIPNSFLAHNKPFGRDKDWMQPYYGKVYSNPKYYPAFYEHNLDLEDDDESLRQCHKKRAEMLESSRKQAAKLMKNMQTKGKGLWKKRFASPVRTFKGCSKGTVDCAVWD